MGVGESQLSSAAGLDAPLELEPLVAGAPHPMSSVLLLAVAHDDDELSPPLLAHESPPPELEPLAVPRLKQAPSLPL